MSVWNQANEEINVLAMDLGTTPPTSPIWAASLDQGSHPSDPAYVKTDPSTGYVLITTTDSSTGAVWLWKLDGANGNEAWSPRSMGNTDGDSNVPHVRMPGPVVANLDSDAALEVVVTIPTDLGGTGNADGAEYRALRSQMVKQNCGLLTRLMDMLTRPSSRRLGRRWRFGLLVLGDVDND